MKCMGIVSDGFEYEGEHRLDEEICVVRWQVQDLLDMFAMLGVECSDANIDRFLATRAPRTLDERSTEEGWEILEDLVCMEMKGGDDSADAAVVVDGQRFTHLKNVTRVLGGHVITEWER